ncbi:MAG: phosphoglucosamine mutase [Alphaproteobacteria bacterium]
MAKLFGTDGIRGTVNAHPMTSQIAMDVAVAAGHIFRAKLTHRPTVLIAKDTRLSGYQLEPAMVSGFTSAGWDVLLLGPMPTPAVAALTLSMRADLGVMLSASHNPFHDNGIKLFGAQGYKLSDEVEAEIEALVERMGQEGPGFALAPPDQLGRVRRLDGAAGRYMELVKASFPTDLRLDGLKVAVDCAHGAAYRIAPRILYELGADVVEHAVEPNGLNINLDSGATAPKALRLKVLETGADIGLALDGDADRLIVVDEQGRVIDGDQIMALITQTMQQSGRLRGEGLVTTVMSNLGLERFLEANGMRMERTKVGDRFVLERMKTLGWNVGGEQSGHMILSDYATTGDGMVAALQVLSVMVRQQRKASEVLNLFKPVPQLLKNVRFEGANPLETKPVKDIIAEVEAEFGDSGRLVIRKSGTEPLVRVMAEGDNAKVVERAVDRICDVVRASAA